MCPVLVKGVQGPVLQKHGGVSLVATAVLAESCLGLEGSEHLFLPICERTRC